MRDWLKKARTDKKYSQYEAASLSGIYQSFYCDVENGKKRPSVETAKKIADILGFDWTRFYEEERS